MPLANKKEKNKIIEILTLSFETNPSVLWVIKNDTNLKSRIQELCKYSFKTAFIRNGAYISDDGTGVALCFRYNYKKEGIADYLNQAVLLLKSIGIDRLGKVLKRESYIKSKRPSDGNFLYFWYLGVHPHHQNGNAARELKKEILKISREQQLPIYLETSVMKNKNVYERFGFEVYHIWKQETQPTLYFMRRMPENIN